MSFSRTPEWCKNSLKTLREKVAVRKVQLMSQNLAFGASGENEKCSGPKRLVSGENEKILMREAPVFKRKQKDAQA